MRYLSWMLATLVTLFLMQGITLSQSGESTTKSESNFYSSVARIQTGIQHAPRVMLLGSSMTGRLPDRHDGFTGVANLGCDGGSAVDMLRAIDRRLLPAAPVLIIEGNTLHRTAAPEDSEIFNTIQKPWFRAGLNLPMVAANARPSAFAYSFIRARKLGVAEGPVGPSLPVAANPRNDWPESRLSEEFKPLMDELPGIIERLQSRSIRMVIVILPPGDDEDSPKVTLPRELSRLSGIPLIDLTDGLPDDAVRFTDGIHMDPASAAASLRTILEAVEP